MSGQYPYQYQPPGWGPDADAYRAAETARAVMGQESVNQRLIEAQRHGELALREAAIRAEQEAMWIVEQQRRMAQAAVMSVATPVYVPADTSTRETAIPPTPEPVITPAKANQSPPSSPEPTSEVGPTEPPTDPPKIRVDTTVVDFDEVTAASSGRQLGIAVDNDGGPGELQLSTSHGSFWSVSEEPGDDYGCWRMLVVKLELPEKLRSGPHEERFQVKLVNGTQTSAVSISVKAHLWSASVVLPKLAKQPPRTSPTSPKPRRRRGLWLVIAVIIAAAYWFVNANSATKLPPTNVPVAEQPSPVAPSPSPTPTIAVVIKPQPTVQTVKQTYASAAPRPSASSSAKPKATATLAAATTPWTIQDVRLRQLNSTTFVLTWANPHQSEVGGYLITDSNSGFNTGPNPDITSVTIDTSGWLPEFRPVVGNSFRECIDPFKKGVLVNGQYQEIYGHTGCSNTITWH